MPTLNFPWKRNLQFVPEDFLKRVAEMSTNFVQVAATKKIDQAHIKQGLYSHVGLESRDGSLFVSATPLLPPTAAGKWSARNREGWERKRLDLPKFTRTFSWETPNFGDASTYGTHTTYRDREVYPVDIYEARRYCIKTELLNSGVLNASSALVKFSLDAVLDRTRPDFEQELLWALNILQENCGVAGVYPSDASRDDFIGSIALDWAVFPPGTISAVVAAMRGTGRVQDDKVNKAMADRIKLFAKLKPKAYLRGIGGFNTYVGAQFAGDLVVFENTTYGNALYVLYENWAEISKRSRLDLLRGTSESFTRFVHTEGWEERFLVHMREQLEARLAEALI